MEIHELVRAGDVEGVREQIARGVPVDVRDEEGRTPLDVAFQVLPSPEMIQLLIEAGPNIETIVEASAKVSREFEQVEASRPPIVAAAKAGDLDRVRSLLDAGADLHAVDGHGYGVLISAIYGMAFDAKLPSVVEFLLARGVATEVVTDYGETPLLTALQLGRLDVIGLLLAAGVDPTPLRWTELMRATALGNAADVEAALADAAAQGDDGSDGRDRAGNTPLHLAVLAGDVSKLGLLRPTKSDLDAPGHFDQTALMLAAAWDRTEVLGWLIGRGADLDRVDTIHQTALMHAAERGAVAAVERLLEAGADAALTGRSESAMKFTTDERVARRLAAAGEPFGDASFEMKRRLTGLGERRPPDVTEAEYLAGKTRRFGRSNPDVMDVPFWREVIASGETPYPFRKQFDERRYDEPIWCFDRLGHSMTELPDGRFVQIGGEHEDHYDPDFCIYNDVVVHDGPGTFRILGYPRDVFPPTDFHTATYVDGSILIIGRLGYSGERDFGTTPVYRLDATTWRIEDVPTVGDGPGWIFEHRARLASPREILVTGGKVARLVDGEEDHPANEGQFRLDLSSWTWSRSA